MLPLISNCSPVSAGAAVGTSLLLGLAGCGGAGSADSTTTLMAGVIYNPDVPIVSCGLSALEENTSLSELGIEIQTTDSAQLGGENELLEQAGTGELDIAFAAGSTLATVFGIPELEMFEAYYLYDEVDDLARVRDTEIATEAFGKLPDEAGVYAVGDPWLYGERHVFGNVEINSADDFVGVKYRVPETDISIKSAEALGASPTTTAYSELYMALQQGIVDTAEAPLSVMFAESLNEPSSYLNMTGHLITASSPLVNASRYDALSSEQQDGLTTAMSEAAAITNDCVEEEDADALAEMEASPDIEINDDVDRDALRQMVEESYKNDFVWSDDYSSLLEELK